jgi:MATE family multidrug resistance protein
MGVGLVTAVANQVAAAASVGPTAAGASPEAGPDRPETDVTAVPAGHEEIRDLVRAALAIATVAGLGGALVIAGLGQVLPWLGQDPAVVALARPMLVALAPGLLPCLWFQAIRQYTVGMRRPQALLGITVASIALNAGLNWAFLHGLWWFPELGLAGIGLSTSTVYSLSFLALYGAARRDAGLRPMLSLRGWLARPATLRRLLRLGVPVAATYGSEAGFFSVVALLMGTFGAAALAAHTAVNQLVYLVFQVSVGLSHAASVTVSGEIARGRPGAAARTARAAVASGFAAMAAVGIAYAAVPELVLRPFAPPGSAVLAVAVPLLAVAAVLQFADCAQSLGVGLLRGLDDTAGGFRLTLVGYWLVGLPAAWLIGLVAGAGPVGVWIGLLAGLATTAVLLLRRFASSLRRWEPPTTGTSGRSTRPARSVNPATGGTTGPS